MEEYCRFAFPFLALPPGWWFHKDGKGNIGASFDEGLLVHPGFLWVIFVSTITYRQ
jgi:hypothetical protein